MASNCKGYLKLTFKSFLPMIFISLQKSLVSFSKSVASAKSSVLSSPFSSTLPCLHKVDCWGSSWTKDRVSGIGCSWVGVGYSYYSGTWRISSHLELAKTCQNSKPQVIVSPWVIPASKKPMEKADASVATMLILENAINHCTNIIKCWDTRTLCLGHMKPDARRASNSPWHHWNVSLVTPLATTACLSGCCHPAWKITMRHRWWIHTGLRWVLNQQSDKKRLDWQDRFSNLFTLACISDQIPSQ